MSRQHFKIGKGISLSPVASRPVDPENGDVVYNGTFNRFEKYENGNWSVLDNNSGFNIIKNGDAETDVQIFTAYADAAATRPVDGVGGSPTVTAGFLFSPAIRGERSFSLSKPASNVQGQGWSIANTTIEPEFRAKPLRFSFAYRFLTSDFVAGSNGSSPTDGDAIVTFYDVTNNKIVEPSNIKFFSNSSTLVDTFECTVQFDSNTTSIRPIIHVATTGTNAWQMIVDSVALSPQLVTNGSLSTKWTAYTPIFQNLGTPTGIEMFYRLEGPNLEIEGRWTNGTVGAGTATFTIPPVGTVDLPNSRVLGVYGHQGSATGELLVWGGGNLIQFGGDNWQVPMSGTQLATNGFTTVKLSVPIVGQGASVKLSEPGDNRPFLVSTGMATGQTIPHNTITKVNFNEVYKDFQGSYDSVNNRYRIFSADTYRIHGCINIEANTAIYAFNARLFVNGLSANRIQEMGKSGTANTPDMVTFDFTIDLKAGDYVEMYCFQGSGVSLNIRGNNTAGQLSVMHIEKASQGSQAIAAGEKVKTIVRQSSGQVIPSSVITTLIHNTKELDTHGLYDTATGIWRQNRAGTGTIQGAVHIDIGTAATASLIAFVYRNGVEYAIRWLTVPNLANTYGITLSVPISGVSGDQWTVRFLQTTGVNRSMTASTTANYICYELD